MSARNKFYRPPPRELFNTSDFERSMRCLQPDGRFEARSRHARGIIKVTFMPDRTSVKHLAVVNWSFCTVAWRKT